MSKTREKREKIEAIPLEGTISTASEKKQVEERVAIGAHIVYEAIRREGEEELGRPAAALAWSGLAAGLSMGFSFIAEAFLESYLPKQPWQPPISKVGYSVGFLVVVLGRQQLFTESTLTARCSAARTAENGLLRCETVAISLLCVSSSWRRFPVQPLALHGRGIFALLAGQASPRGCS